MSARSAPTALIKPRTSTTENFSHSPPESKVMQGCLIVPLVQVIDSYGDLLALVHPIEAYPSPVCVAGTQKKPAHHKRCCAWIPSMSWRGPPTPWTRYAAACGTPCA